MKSAICLIVRNEARDIAEWVAFHAAVGFDTQIVFDNRSDDGTGEILKAAATLHDLRYHYWPDSGPRYQVGAYEAACAAYKLEFDWIAFVDSDEFLLPSVDEPINTFLARYEGWSGIAVNWAVFGSSGHDAMPDGLVIENFTHRAQSDFLPTRHAKSVIRPGFAARCLNPHCFDMRGDRLGSYCDAAGRTIEWWPAPEHGGIMPGVTRMAPDYAQCRIHHYFTRSRAHWAAKVRRGYPSDIAVRRMAEFAEYDRNEVEDRTALRYVAKVRDGIAAIAARRRPPSEKASGPFLKKRTKKLLPD